MINVNQITAILERLPDAQLQQYAAMHKQDPYTLALAVEESNRRKRMRAAPQGQPQQQGEAPPINEQAVQAMAPEDIGIAQLPTGDMEFADGGIIAFAGGAGEGGVQQPATPAGRWFSGLRDAYSRNAEIASLQRALKAQYGPASAVPGLFMTQSDEERQRAKDIMSRLDQMSPAEMRFILENGPGAMAPAQPAAPAKGAAPATAAGAPTPEKKEDAPKLNVDGVGGPPREQPEGRAGLPAVAMPTVSAFPVRKPFQEQYAAARATLSDEMPENIRREMDAASKAEVERTEEALRRYEAERPQGLAREGLQKRLEKEEAEVPQKKEENFRMALVNAGLAMMASTSPHAFVGIGTGAQQGMKSYQEGLKDLEKAAEKRRELMDAVEQTRRAEAEGRAKDALAGRNRINEIHSQWTKTRVDFLVQRTGTNDAEARAMVRHEDAINESRAKATLEATTRLQTAQIAANASLAAASRAQTAQERALAATQIRERAANLRKELELAAKLINTPNPLMQGADKQLALKQYEDASAELQRMNEELARLSGMPTRASTAGTASTGAPAQGNRVPKEAFWKQ